MSALNSTLSTRVVVEALTVGAASLIAGNTTPITACLVGGTYAVVDHVTKPFFNNQRGILSFLTNAFITTGLVNHFAGLALSSSRVAYITFLPAIAVGKIILAGLAALLLISCISAGYKQISL